jgi:4a-hydroxytetrahydrobiopterin dehydratase
MKLSPENISEQLQSLSGWTLNGNAIRKQFQFEDFIAAMTFVGRVAELAEEANHHPDIEIRYNKVLLALSTHDAGGLTDKDFELAARIEQL